MRSLTLDYANMLTAGLPQGGLDAGELEGSLSETHGRAIHEMEARRREDELGFVELPYAVEKAQAVQELADGFGQWFENLVVLAAGGSGLGTLSLRDALLGPGWNERDEEDRDHYPRLYVLDTMDPGALMGLLGRLDLRRTLFNVVSKSGSSADAVAQYLVVEARLRGLLGEDATRGHLLFTTDPQEGVLRKIADEDGVPSLEIPSDVSGAYTVLSAAGLLPAAVVGIDILEVLEGARDMAEVCLAPTLKENPAGLLAALLHHADTVQGLPIHVFMPYADGLRSFAAWAQHLWAGSLGRTVDREGRTTQVGPTPLVACGATGGHGLLQLLLEGPRDKVVISMGVGSMGVGSPPDPVNVPPVREGLPEARYLGGRTMADLLTSRRLATMEALRRQGRPSLSLEVAALTPRAMGELFVLFQVAAALAGVHYGVDSLAGPGAESGRILVNGILGAEGLLSSGLGTGDHPWRV